MMRLDEIAPQLLMEMAYTRQRAMQIITGLEMQINLHLLKLLAVPLPDQFDHWRKELDTWLTTIATIRLKPSSKPGPPNFYFKLLYDEPFGGSEVASIGTRLALLRRQYGKIRDDLDVNAVAARLKAFHRSFADDCAAGVAGDKIESLLAGMTAS